MSIRKVSISVDSFPRDQQYGYHELGQLLESEPANSCISGLHYPADLLEDIYQIDELNHFIMGSDRVIEHANIIADISFSGGFKATERQLTGIKRRNPAGKLMFVISHGLSNWGIEALVEKYQKVGELEFLLSGVLPEDEITLEDIAQSHELEEKVFYDNIAESFGKTSEELTEYVLCRVGKMNERIEATAKEVDKNAARLGVIGVYGSARYAYLERGNLIYVGAGVSDDGAPYESEGIWKHSTELDDASRNCDEIVVGHLIKEHPDGSVAGLGAVYASLQKTLVR